MSDVIEAVNTEKMMDTNGDFIPQQESLKETILLAQHDWNHVNSENNETFYVGYRLHGEKSEFFDVSLDKTNGEFQNDVLKCKKLPSRALNLEFKSLNVGKTFISPHVEFDKVHKAAVSSLDVSSEVNLVVSVDSLSGLVVWNPENGTILKGLEGHILDVNCCKFFPSGMVILSGGMDMSVRVWSVDTGECPRVLNGHKAPILDLAFIGRGEEVLSASKDGTVKQWNCGLGKSVSTLNLPSGFPTCMKLNDERSLLVVGSDRGYLYIFDANSKNVVASLFLGTVCTSLAVHDNYAFVGGDTGIIVVVDIRANVILQRLKIDRGRVHRLSTVSNGLLAAFADGGVCLYNDPTNSAQSKFEFTGADCDSIYDFAQTSSSLFTACRDKIVRKYSLGGLFN